MAALHADDAVKIDRRTTGLRRLVNIRHDRSSTSPWNTRIRGVVAQRYTLQADTHGLGGYFARLALGDGAAGVLGVHLGGPDGDGAHAVGMPIDLHSHLDAAGVGADPDRGFQRLAADRLQVLRLRMRDNALDHVAHQRERRPDRRDHLGVPGDLAGKPRRSESTG